MKEYQIGGFFHFSMKLELVLKIEVILLRTLKGRSMESEAKNKPEGIKKTMKDLRKI